MKHAKKKIFILSLFILLIGNQLWGMKKKVKPTLFANDKNFVTYFFYFIPDQNTFLTLRLVSKNYRNWVSNFFSSDNRFIMVYGKEEVEKVKKLYNFMNFLRRFPLNIGIKLHEKASQKTHNMLFRKILWATPKYCPRTLHVDASRCKKIKDFSHLKNCTNLISLNLSQTLIKIKHLKTLLNKLPNLQKLSLNDFSSYTIRKTFEDEKTLKKLKSLTNLRLRNTRITNLILAHICTNLSKLEILDITYYNPWTEYDDAVTDLSRLALLPNLKQLHLSLNEKSRQELEAILNDQSQLQILEIQNSKVLPNGLPLEKLDKLKNLKRLILPDAGLEYNLEETDEES